MLALTTIVVFVVVVFPAGTAWSFVREDVTSQVPDLKVSEVRGTIWQGEAGVVVGALPPLSINWDLDFLPLMTGRVAADLIISGDGANANLNVSASTQAVAVTGEAIVDSRYVNQVSINYGLETSQQFQLTDLDVTADTAWLTLVDGEITWPGGTVILQTPVELLTRQVPPLLAELGLHDGEVLLDVASDGIELMHIRIKRDGWAEVTVLNALMRTLNLPLPDGSNIDMTAPALIFEEKLF